MSLSAWCASWTHHYYYWFAFPAFAMTPPPRASPAVELAAVLDETQLMALRHGFAALASKQTSSPRAPAFFAVRIASPCGVIEVEALSKFIEWRDAEAKGDGEALLAFCDPCPMREHPGWPLRNLLTLANVAMLHRRPLLRQEANVRVICFREPPMGTSASLTSGSASEHSAGNTVRSILLHVTLPPMAEEVAKSTSLPAKAVGWERNAAGKLGARLMDLSAQMQPEALAEASVDLNLRLMRWRLMPSLQTAKIAATRCLLMGAGTLGCAVARCLLGWGVRAITFVDAGVVSYSNPVRQTLYNFEDCIGGDKPKAQAAADALKRIFPSVLAKAHQISIPMPGHAVGKEEVERVAADCERLSQLVQEHDVVFLLTDTRESRWLPSLLAAAHDKLVINSALGFDSLLVMRHGMRGQNQGDRLGCYFCNDVVAPANSMLRRTLDQQCTVSRPGLSMIASAMAVELMVTLLHHPSGGNAHAELVEGSRPTATSSPLGSAPHQLRVALPFFRTDVMTGCSFDKCTACSPTVLHAFDERGFAFLLEAFNRATYLEDLTGLTKMHAETEAALEDVDVFDDDDD